MHHEEWETLARDLGARAFESSLGSGGDARHRSFAMRLRERRGPAVGKISTSHVLLGTRSGGRFLLEHHGERATARLALTVELTPSLGLCAFIGTPAWIRGLGKPKLVHLGDPVLDDALCLEASEPERLVELLRPQSEADRTLLRAIVSEGYVITDTTVVATMESEALVEGGIPLIDQGQRPVTASEIHMKVDRMIWVARELAARRPRVRLTPEAQQLREAWAAVAAARGLVFDAETQTILGESAAAQLSMGIETRLAALAVEEGFTPFSTALSAAFSRPIGLSLRVAKAGLLNRVWEVFGADITVGDKPFDKAFSVAGSPEDAVRERLRPATSALVSAAEHDSELTLDDGGLFMLIPGVLRTQDHAGKALDLFMAIVDALRIVPTQTPYRS